MNRRQSWILEVQELGQDLARGVDPDPERVRTLLAEVESLTSEASLQEVRELQAALDSLRNTCTTRKDEIQEEMASIGKTREAIRGYGGLEEQHKGQRLFRKA